MQSIRLNGVLSSVFIGLLMAMTGYGFFLGIAAISWLFPVFILVCLADFVFRKTWRITFGTFLIYLFIVTIASLLWMYLFNMVFRD